MVKRKNKEMRGKELSSKVKSALDAFVKYTCWLNDEVEEVEAVFAKDGWLYNDGKLDVPGYNLKIGDCLNDPEWLWDTIIGEAEKIAKKYGLRECGTIYMAPGGARIMFVGFKS